MAITERLALLVTLDAQGAVKGFNDLGKAADRNLGKSDQRLDQFASRFQKAGAGMLAASGLAAAGLYKAGQSAGELEQALGGTDAVFGDASAVIDDFAKKAAQSAGLSETAFRSATTSIGGQLKGLGFDVESAASQAVNLTQVAADLAATYGGTTAEAVAALGAAFRGEADPAERFNLFLNQNRVNLKAVELGLADTTSAVDANAKAQATLALITEQSVDAQGQFAREQDTAQGAMARFSAEAENLKAALGGAVAPVLADVADSVGGLVERFNNLSPATQNAVSRFALMGTAAVGTAGALSFSIGKVIDMRENLGRLTGPFRSAEGGLNRFGKAATALGIAGAVAGMASLATEASNTVVDVDRLSASLADLGDEYDDQTKRQISVIDRMGQLDTVVSQLAEGNAESANRLIDLAEAAGISADRIAGFRDEVEENLRVQARAVVDQQANTEAVGEYVDQLGGVQPAASGAASGIDSITTSGERMRAAVDEANTSMDRFKEGMEDAFAAISVEEATDRRTEAIKDIADRFAEAQDSVKAAQDRVNELLGTHVYKRGDSFESDLAAARAELEEAREATSRALSGDSEAALTNREALRGVVEDIGAVIEKHREEGASLEELREIRYLELENLRGQLEQLGFNREEIGRYIEAIENIPITKSTTLTVESAQAEENLRRLIGLLERIDSLKKSGLAFSADTLQAESQLMRRAGSVAPSSIPTTSGPVSRTTVITVNNPVPEPFSDTIRRARSEAALMGS